MATSTLPIAAEYRAAIRVALALQVPLAVLISLLLDGGATARIGGCTMAGFWMGAAVIMLRRPLDPAPLDLWYIRWGYPVLLVAAVAIAAAVGR